MLRIGKGILVAGLLSLAFAAPANATFIATANDPSADASDPSPGRDITAVGLSYDRKEGELEGFVRFRGSPGGTPSFITLFAGTRVASGCNGFPAAGFGSDSDEFGASWLRLDSPGPAAARGDALKRGFDSNVQRFEVDEGALAGRNFNCAVATITEPRNASRVYDTSGPIALVGQPEMSVRIGTRKRYVRNRATSMLIRVSNPGDGPAQGVKVRLGKTRGLKLSPRAKSLGTIAPGKRKTYKVRLRFSNRARVRTELQLKATSGRLVASGKVRLNVRPLPRRRSPNRGGGGRDFTPQTCTRYSPDLSGQTGGSLILVPC